MATWAWHNVLKPILRSCLHPGQYEHPHGQHTGQDGLSNPWQYSHYKYTVINATWNLFPKSVLHNIFVKSLLSSYPWPCCHHLPHYPQHMTLTSTSQKKRSLDRILLTFCYCSSWCKEKGAPPFCALDPLTSCFLGTLYHHLPSHVSMGFSPWTVNHDQISPILKMPKHQNKTFPCLTFSCLNLLQLLPFLPISPKSNFI